MEIFRPLQRTYIGFESLCPNGTFIQVSPPHNGFVTSIRLSSVRTNQASAFANILALTISNNSLKLPLYLILISICLPETVFNWSRHIFRIYFTLFRTEINTKKWRLIYDTNFRYFFVVEILTAECCHDLIMRVPKRFAAESATLFAPVWHQKRHRSERTECQR